ncbi:DUF6538 domain-containing protein [Paracoccus yeei]|uniref:Site-specific integrase n=1 Tax=Paracoccus yeei TaxID=147645 RepID=A0A5P2QVL0_9RHOB|nr:DUF6538 domain-containing protein [Paracoccus yeei]QEU09543.1 site-specific integrase [Paracoccus yeei]
MAGQVRHLKVKDGRFYARVAVPVALQPILGKKELTAPLGADRREATRALPSAVAALQAQIGHAKGIAKLREPLPHRAPITTQDYGLAVWQRYMAMLAEDEAKRDRLPTPAAIEAEQAKVVQRFQREGIPDDPLAVVEQSLDLLVMRNAQSFDKDARQARLDALRRELAANETHQVEHEIDAYLDQHGLAAPAGSAERVTLAKHLMRAEIEGLERTLERDRGDYGGKPSDPIVRPPAGGLQRVSPMKLDKLWHEYVMSRKILGSMRDNGRRQYAAVESLKAFLKHDDPTKITKKDMVDWLDFAVTDKAVATVSKVYLPTLRSLFRWAVEKDKLPSNPAETLRLGKPKRIQTREKGYTTPEAVKVLQFCRDYQPKTGPKGKALEGERVTAAKRWVPILCAFTGARVAEITQLRREDFRQEEGATITRITPEAGATKTGQWRDVPLHPQIIEMGFLDYLDSIPSGPLFHNEPHPHRFVYAAKKLANRIGDWLKEQELVPAGVQPSHGWRHRLKTVGREVGIDGRVLDCIQGHAPRTAGDDYGDVTVKTRIAAIHRLPRYELDS